jgi:hypothetical protein
MSRSVCFSDNAIAVYLYIKRTFLFLTDFAHTTIGNEDCQGKKKDEVLVLIMLTYQSSKEREREEKKEN